jgi:catechol 2,3-dioxygenase-like lactoylglutathione lyase family enzyme
MISGFDHVVIAVRDLAAGVAAYEALLGGVVGVRFERDGVTTAVIETENIAVELMAPTGEGANAQRLSAALEAGDGLKSLVFATDDVERAHVRCERVGLAPEAIQQGEDQRSFRISTEHTHGARLFVLQREAGVEIPVANGVTGLDHIVIRTPDAERAAALYGARLGLDMRLDRIVVGRRLMFFRCGDAIVEIMHDPREQKDLLFGLSWRVADADEANQRLASAGIDVSQVRQGMKPGTRVFTVRNAVCGVPTLMIETGSKPG